MLGDKRLVTVFDFAILTIFYFIMMTMVIVCVLVLLLLLLLLLLLFDHNSRSTVCKYHFTLYRISNLMDIEKGELYIRFHSHDALFVHISCKAVWLCVMMQYDSIYSHVKLNDVCCMTSFWGQISFSGLVNGQATILKDEKRNNNIRIWLKILHFLFLFFVCTIFVKCIFGANNFCDYHWGENACRVGPESWRREVITMATVASNNATVFHRARLRLGGVHSGVDGTFDCTFAPTFFLTSVCWFPLWLLWYWLCYGTVWLTGAGAVCHRFP